MTSGSGVDAVVHELRFSAVAAATAGGAAVAATGTHGATVTENAAVAIDRAAAGEVAAAAAAGGGCFHFKLDFDAPERWPDVPYDTAAPAARHDAAARAQIASVLEGAGLTMARRVPAAFDFVNNQLQRVLLRRCDSAPGTSASHRSHVGCCLLTNLQQPVEALQVAIEALTHEAIHQLLYRTERDGGNFCDLAEMPTFRSPWSGARLPLHSLVHACFVWFGLLTLWSELALTPASVGEAAHARGRIAHCLFGFAFLDDLLDSPAFPVASVEPQVLSGIRGLSAAARRATVAAEPLATTLRQAASVRQHADWPAALATDLARMAG